jgi:hypothetical protein
MVIILLIAAGAIGLSNAHSIQASAAALVTQQLTTRGSLRSSSASRMR